MLTNYKKIGIWGMGIEGISAHDFITARFPDKKIIIISEDNLPDLFACDCIVKSPGVSLYRGEIQKLRDKHIALTSPSNLFLHYKHPATKTIAISGTKGKSTTATLLHHTLKSMGINAGLGGNIGTPLLSLIDSPYEYVIMEVSSYQAADLAGKIDMAAITNLYPEHLQWHTTHNQYYKDKIHLLQLATTSFINGGQKTALPYFIHAKSPHFFNTPSTMHIENNMFMHDKSPLFSTQSLNLPGVHNQINALIVLSILHHLGLDCLQAESAFKTMQSLPHRLQIIAKTPYFTAIDDSISTTPETAIAALNTFDNDNTFFHLIIGGQDRGQDFTHLINHLLKIRHRCHLITLPDTGKTAHNLAKEYHIPTTHTDNMQGAVKIAKTHLSPHHQNIILLSPASPSYNQYKNYIEKGLDFQNCIANSI